MVPGLGAVLLMGDAKEAWKKGDFFGAISCAVGALGNIALTAGLLVMAGVPIAGFAAITGLAATIGAVATSGYAFGNALYYAAEEARTTGSISADTKLDLVYKSADLALTVWGGMQYAQALETAAAAEKTAATGLKENAPVENPETGLVGGCFIAGTQIQTADGTKNIEDIKAGDEVYAYDTETGEKVLKRVLKTFVHNVTELLHVTVNGETIHTTPNHPFYVEGVGFKRADELKAGDRVRLLNGEIRKVDKLEPESLKHPVKVFNFKVADWHDYYVGTHGVLVHNADNPCAVTVGGSYSETPMSGDDWHRYFNEKYGTNNVTWDSASIDDIIDMPSRITDFSPEQVADLAQKSGWSVEPLGKGSLKGIQYEQGGGLSMHTPNGSSLYIQYHPGGGHHGEMPYFKVSSGQNGIRRFFINGLEVGN
ncbi:MAG: hypothetical protein E7294_10800 [Lachnospiraceae bacterium]|nr:hypothetical protein [Lachnospiraceae bacterium]